MINCQCGADSTPVGAGVDALEFALCDLDLHARLLGSLLNFAQADRLVLGGPVGVGPTGRCSAPSPGEHQASPRHRATTRVAPTMLRLRMPVHAWWQRNVYFLSPGNFTLCVIRKQSPLKGRYFVKRAGKKGGDHWVALCPVPLPLRTHPPWATQASPLHSAPLPLSR